MTMEVKGEKGVRARVAPAAGVVWAEMTTGGVISPARRFGRASHRGGIASEQEDFRQRQRAGMRDRQQRPVGAERLETAGTASVKPQLRGAARTNDFEVAPEHAAGMSRAKRLHAGLLGREPAGEVGARMAPLHTVRDLAGGEYALEKPRPEAVEACLDARNLRQVEADPYNGHMIEADPLPPRQPPEPTGGFIWTQERWGAGLRCEALSRIASHVFTTRDLRLARSPDVDATWRLLGEAVGVPVDRVVRVAQVHGGDVLVVRRGEALPGRPPPADIIVSDHPETALVVRVADCVPLLLAHPRTGAVAAAHAGWRGMAARVPGVAVRALQEEFGAAPAELVAAFGPSIGACCYAVGTEVREAFATAGHPVDRWFVPSDGRFRLDLWRATREQLEAAGVPPRQTCAAGLCTATHRDRFFSYRMEGLGAGRLAAAIRPSARAI
jgi:polyphenol oxidase